jgi:hypothetical protein
MRVPVRPSRAAVCPSTVAIPFRRRCALVAERRTCRRRSSRTLAPSGSMPSGTTTLVPRTSPIVEKQSRFDRGPRVESEDS